MTSRGYSSQAINSAARPRSMRSSRRRALAANKRRMGDMSLATMKLLALILASADRGGLLQIGPRRTALHRAPKAGQGDAAGPSAGGLWGRYIAHLCDVAPYR